MLRFSKQCKPLGCVSKDASRTGIYHAQIVRRDDTLELHATDSFMAVIIPLDGDTSADNAEGPVSRDALAAAQKVGHLHPTAETIDVDGVSYPRDHNSGQFPNLDAVWPAEDRTVVLEVGLNAKKLAVLAAALGDDEVKLTFESPLRPIGVTVNNSAARGILMPVRVN